MESGLPVGNPSFERILGRAGKVTDVHPTLIQIERQGVRSPSRSVRDASASAGSVKR